MAIDYNVQDSITIRRLRSSDNVILQFSNNGTPLFQAVDEDSGAVNPDWTVPSNQPIVTPRVTSVRGNSITHIWHKWKYNGVELIFNGQTSGGWTKDSTGRFQTNENGELKIIANLASKINLADDTLNYETQISIGGVEYELKGERIITIQKMGASSYYAMILADTDILTSDVTSTNVTTKLYQGANEITNYYTKWYKDSEAWTDKNGQKTISINRDDVGGSQLFIVDFFKSSTDTSAIARTAVKITDSADNFKVAIDITSDNKEVWKDKNGVSHNVTVKAKIINVKKGSVYTPVGAVWKLDIMDRETWKSLKSSNTDTITITTAETDRNGIESDVDVIAEVTFN